MKKIYVHLLDGVEATIMANFAVSQTIVKTDILECKIFSLGSKGVLFVTELPVNEDDRYIKNQIVTTFQEKTIQRMIKTFIDDAANDAINTTKTEILKELVPCGQSDLNSSETTQNPEETKEETNKEQTTKKKGGKQQKQKTKK